MKTYYDNFGNRATIKEVMTLPNRGAKEKQKGYLLTLSATYDDDFIYHVSLFESQEEAYRELIQFSLNTWKE